MSQYPMPGEKREPRDARIAELEAQIDGLRYQVLARTEERNTLAIERDQARAERDIAVEALTHIRDRYMDNQLEEAYDTANDALAQLPQAAERARLTDAVVAAARVPAVMDAIREASERHDPSGSQFFATARGLLDALAALDAHEQGGGGGG